MTRLLHSPLALLCTAFCAVLLTDPIGANSEVNACRAGCLAGVGTRPCREATCPCHLTSDCTVGVRAAAGPEKKKEQREKMAEGGGAGGPNLWFHPMGPWLDFGR